MYEAMRTTALQMLRRSIAGGLALSGPYNVRSNTAGTTSATTARHRRGAALVAAVRSGCRSDEQQIDAVLEDGREYVAHQSRLSVFASSTASPTVVTFPSSCCS